MSGEVIQTLSVVKFSTKNLEDLKETVIIANYKNLSPTPLIINLLDIKSIVSTLEFPQLNCQFYWGNSKGLKFNHIIRPLELIDPDLQMDG